MASKEIARLLHERSDIEDAKNALSEAANKVGRLTPIQEGQSHDVQGDNGGLRPSWIDFDFGCSTILPGQ